MRKLEHIFILALLLGFSTIINAQDEFKESDAGGFMRSNGRIYVVAAVMLTILIGLILYLVRIDRKISKLEKEK
jgi:Ca2+/Na+ antiporter